MIHTRVKKIIVVSAISVLLSACGGGSDTTGAKSSTTQETAITAISDFAENGGTAPSVQDYIDAGISGVDSSNIDDVNRAAETFASEDLDTVEELQTFINGFGEIIKGIAIGTIGDFAKNGGDTPPSLKDYVDTGVLGANEDNANQMNAIMKTMRSYLESISSNTQALNIDSVEIGKLEVSGPSVQDYNNAGASDVDGNNIDEINTLAKKLNTDDTADKEDIQSLIYRLDRVAPVITLNGDDQKTIEANSTYTDEGASATDNVDETVTVVTAGSVDTSILGEYALTYSASDNAGNEANEVTRTVSVVDSIAPVISLNGDNPVTIEVGSSYTDSGASVTDNFDESVSIVTTGNVSTNTVGTYTITYTASDDAGNEATVVTRTINVVDTTSPIITILGDSSVTIERGSSYVDSGASATDNVDGTLPIITTGNVDTNTAGVYAITYTATDSSGNTSNAIRTITVEFTDVIAPVITVAGDNPLSIEFGETYTDAGATASDDVDGEVNITATGTVDTSALGPYTITYSATDSANNQAIATRTVYVIDTTAPVVTLLGDNPQVVSLNSDYSDPGATATDNVDGDIPVAYVTSNVDTSITGDYSVTYQAYDNAQNASAVVTRVVTVQVDASSCTTVTPEYSFALVDTNQTSCYDSDTGVSTACSGTGQDGEYAGNQPSYSLCSDDEVVVDNVTGLMWQASTDTDGVTGLNDSDKKTQSEATSYCSALTYGEYSDWRLPSTKELSSIYLFSGLDSSGITGSSTSVDLTESVPFLDTEYFDIGYGDYDSGERLIDGQYATSTLNISQVMSGITSGLENAYFGVNFVDGHIKAYESELTNRTDPNYYVRCVRGNSDYGTNNFSFTDNGTTFDNATNLEWDRNDSSSSDFDDALEVCSASTTGSKNDWRLPNMKELQSILDYSKSPDATGTPSIDTTYFNSTSFINEAGETDWGYYWSSTALLTSAGLGHKGAYITFGRGLGYINGSIVDVHGAGAQRSDEKIFSLNGLTTITADASATFGTTAYTDGPQGDILRTEHNYVRCVRSDADEIAETETPTVEDITDKILTNGSGNCADFVAQYSSNVTDVNNETDFTGSLEIEVANSSCTFTSNSIPNHDFNDGNGFSNTAAEVSASYTITTNPSKAASASNLTLGSNQAILLNGVPVALLPAGCYGVDDGVKNCTDMNQPWRANPGSGLGRFQIDSHNAHTQATGLYHYHATPVALFDTSGSVESPVIGFASDGFPIYGSYYSDDNGDIVKIESSYQLKSGTRVAQTYDGVEYLPSTSSDSAFAVESDNYDGQYADDYEYNADKSLLDECNGMTLNGEYAYYVTDGYPYIIGCISGIAGSSFSDSLK